MSAQMITKVIVDSVTEARCAGYADSEIDSASQHNDYTNEGV